MAFDGLFLHNLINELQFLENARIQKINQIAKNIFILNIHQKSNFKLLISLERTSSRIHLSNEDFVNPNEPTQFTMLLRKHFEGGIILKISQYELDRIVVIDVLKQNEIGDNKRKKMIIELLGKNSNLIITDNDYNIIDAYFKIGISEEGRTILPKAKYLFPESKKINFINLKDDEILSLIKDKDKDELMNTLMGISPLLSENIACNNNLLLELKNEHNIPNIFKINNKDDFYFNIICDNILKKYDNLSLLLDDYYSNKMNNDLKSEKMGKLNIHLSNNLKKLNKKLDKLKDDLKTSESHFIYQEYGTLITSNLYKLKDEKLKSITLYSYTYNREIEIPLDNTKTIKQNAKVFFNKYQKAKTSIPYINEQIDIAKKEIEYLNLLLCQIKIADVKDLELIKEELVNEKYIKEQRKGNKKQPKIELQSFDLDGVKVYVGKNNIQNDYLTNKLATKNSMWFHIKDGPGSHVVIFKEDELNEKEIRFCANLAAYYSYYQNSSSVPVVYTKVRNLKHIPGKKNCFLEYKNENLIYIDPDKEAIK